MRKEALFRQKFIKLVLVASVFLVSIFGIIPKAHAQSPCNILSIIKFGSLTYCKNKIVEEIVAIPRTILDAFTASIINVPYTILFNANPDQVGTCGAYWIGQRITDPTQLAALRGQGVLINDTVIADATAEEPTIGCDFNNSLYGSRVAGSMMGVTKYAYDSLSKEKLPVSLAYYYKHNLQKIPVIGNTAYAQVSYNTWGLELALTLWEKTRNIAYAMMSVIMLVIGILIITRKRINPQTVVTVQTAMPRVVISLLLITFSYPIGAIFASMVIPLSVIVMRLFFGTILDTIGSLADMNTLVMVMTLYITTFGGQGMIALLTGAMLGALTIIAMFVVLVKVILINLKILLAIILAPLQFAMSAIPGQEHMIQDWFKQMIARVLAIPAMFFLIGLAWYILVAPFLNVDNLFTLIVPPSDTVNIAEVGISFFRAASSRVMTLVLLPLMTIFTMFTALKADKAVEGFIIGDKKKKK